MLCWLLYRQANRLYGEICLYTSINHVCHGLFFSWNRNTLQRLSKHNKHAGSCWFVFGDSLTLTNMTTLVWYGNPIVRQAHCNILQQWKEAKHCFAWQTRLKNKTVPCARRVDEVNVAQHCQWFVTSTVRHVSICNCNHKYCTKVYCWRPTCCHFALTDASDWNSCSKLHWNSGRLAFSS